MPKKFLGENSKAVVAKARKAAAEADKSEQKKKAEEDAYWEDDDKNAARKQQRKEEQEKKRLEALQRKQASKAALDEEMSTITNNASVSSKPTKITRAQLDAQKERLIAERLKQQQQKELEARNIIAQEETKLEENVNRIVIDGEAARTVDEAISVLSGKPSEVDRHPEKRMKAAYTAFEETHLPRLKQENPTQRLSQLKQMLKKEWLKSPENPLNQRLLDLQSRGSSSED